jgi:hypothetical protein
MFHSFLGTERPKEKSKRGKGIPYLADPSLSWRSRSILAKSSDLGGMGHADVHQVYVQFRLGVAWCTQLEAWGIQHDAVAITLNQAILYKHQS